jgi:flagellar hook-associated protein 1 FlgK
MGLGAAMEIGRNGLTIYRVATEVTGENIANVNTPGYSRQRVILENAPPTTANGFPLGTGVRIATVERYYDGLLQQQIVNAQTTQGYDTTKSTVLQQIEPVFNEISNDGLGSAISKYFSSWQDLTVNPTGTAERQTVISNANILADNFKSISQNLTNTIASQDAALVPLTDSINATLNNIAQLNGQIKQTELVAGNANEMRDQRDQLVRDLSKQIGIRFQENQDGTTDVLLTNGAAPPNYLVQGINAGSLNAVKTPPATTTTVSITDVAGATVAVDPLAASPLYNAPDGGQLWATLQLRDTIIPGYLAQVDTLAYSITTAVNALHFTGNSPTGGSSQNFFAPSAAVAGSAANFGLAAGLTTATIAASGSAVLPGDNTNALAIAQLSGTVTTPAPPATPNASFNGFYSSFVSTVGLDVKSSKTTVSQDAAFTNQLSSLRESNSGVSLDEELTNLVKYQRSYQASAKLISTATEMLDILIGIIR